MNVFADLPGRRIIQLSVAGTAVFTVVNIAEAIVLRWTRPIGVAVNLGLFAIGCVAFLGAYAVAISRSRTDESGVGGLFFLGGAVAPKRVRWWMDGALAVQCVVAVVTASVRPFTTLAFGILVPMFGVGLNGVWGARYGTFGPRIVREPEPETDAPAAPDAAAAGANDALPEGSIGQNAPHG